MKFIVVGYYTKNTIYEGKAKVLRRSLEKYKVPFMLQCIEDLGGWYANTCHKPTFLKEMLEKFPNHNIIYVDCDAEFFAFPELFNSFEGNVGVYLFDRSCYGNGTKGFEVLSGTIFLKNNEEVKEMIEKWEQECKSHPNVWDQKSLQKVLGDNYEKLPGEYCKIFNQMQWIKSPVIVHYQASREVRRNGMKIK